MISHRDLDAMYFEGVLQCLRREEKEGSLCVLTRIRSQSDQRAMSALLVVGRESESGSGVRNKTRG